MATVHVWNKYNIKYGTSGFTKQGGSRTIEYSATSLATFYAKTLFIGKDYMFNANNTITLVNAIEIAKGSRTYGNCGTYPYATKNSATAKQIIALTDMGVGEYYGASDYEWRWSDNSDCWAACDKYVWDEDESAYDAYDMRIYNVGTTSPYSAGTTSYGTVESENRSAYPDNSYSGSYWYVYSHSYESGPEAYVNNGSIKQIQAYTGYNGTVRKCDIYICKDGVISKV